MLRREALLSRHEKGYDMQRATSQQAQKKAALDSRLRGAITVVVLEPLLSSQTPSASAANAAGAASGKAKRVHFCGQSRSTRQPPVAALLGTCSELLHPEHGTRTPHWSTRPPSESHSRHLTKVEGFGTPQPLFARTRP